MSDRPPEDRPDDGMTLFTERVAHDSVPTVLVARHRGAVLGVNTAAAAILGDTDPGRIGHLLFEAGPASRALAEALRAMRPDQEPRLARLRLDSAWSTVPHVVLCSATDEEGLEPLAILQWVAPRPVRPAGRPAPIITQTPATSDAAPLSSSMPARRALWTTDRSGVVTSVDPGLGRRFGGSALAVGDDMVSRLRPLAPALADAVGRVLTTGGAVSATRVAWPRAGGDPLPVEIGCASRRGGAGGLSGFFTLLEAGDDAAVVEAAESPPPAESDAQPTPMPAEEPSGDVDEPGGGLEAAPPQPATGDLSSASDAPSRGSNVIHFPAMRIASVPANFGPEMRSWPVEPPRSAEPKPDFGDLDAPLWAEEPGAGESAGQLSADERDAFAEIGQVLGTRPVAAPSTPDAGLSVPPAHAVSVALAALFDALPVGLLWTIDNTADANAAFRDRAGLAAGPVPDGFVPTAAPGAAIRITGPNGVALDLVSRAGTLFGRRLRWFVLAEASRVPEHPPASPLPLQEPADVLASAAAIDIAADGYALLDDSGTITRLSKGAARLFGHLPADLLGRPVSMLAAPEQVEAWQAILTADSPGPVGHMLVGRTRSGESVALAARAGRIAANGLFIAWTDDTERQRALGALEAARQEAERTSALKSEFLARVSHEVRTPLTAILGFAEVIRDQQLGPVGNSRYLDYMRDIHASGTHVMSLVNDLLDLSRIEAGRMDLRLEAVDANEVIAGCVSTLQQQATRERIILRLSLAPNLPAALADERSLRQIVLNLLSNAIKFNEPGGQVIVSTALIEPDAVAIRIRDTGIGMTDSELEIAMEPFRQVSAVRRAGSGLGLPVTKALVEANCASMTIRSTPGEGTLVEVTFPMVERNAMSLPAE